MKIKKLQSGGMPPLFSTFTPVTVTNPYAGVDPMFLWLQNMGASMNGTASATKGSSSSGSSGSSGMPTLKDTMALLKDMKGLDSDVSTAISALQESAMEAAVLGDTSGIVSSYYRNINLANKVNQSKEAYDEAYKIAKENGGISEAAVTSDGKVIVKDSNNKIQAITPAEYLKNKGRYKLQTNGNLLYSRAHDKNMAFNNAVFDVVQNGTSMDKITDLINSIASKLGTTSSSIEGYTAKEAQKIQSGIAILKKTAEENIESMPKDGIYKTGIKEESQQAQVRLAIDALYAGLGENQKTLLKLKSDGTENGAKSMVAAILMSRTSSNKELSLDYPESMNKDAKSSSGSGESTIEKQVKTNPAVQFFLGYGNKGTLLIQNKSKQAIAFTANNMPLMDKSNNPIPVGTLYDVGQGQFGGMLDTSNATMGDAKLSRSGVNSVIVEGGQIYSAELPIDTNSKVVKPDTKFLQQIEEANRELQGMGINPSGGNTLTPEQIQTVNKVYEKHKLPVKYNSLGELTARYARFAMVNATATANAFEGEPEFGNGVIKVEDENERKNFEANMRRLGDDKFKLGSSYLGLVKDPLYKGVVFIPVYNNIWNALATSNSAISPEVSQQIETLQQQTDARMNYKSPGAWVNL